MRKSLLFALMVVLNASMPLLVLEWIYRAQIIDTYRPELQALNPSQAITDDDRPTLMLMGDSFTASRTSYAGILQDTLQEWRVINGAVSGTGVLQALYMAPHRFARFHPAIFLYQVYVGNDLFDIRYPTNWHVVSFGRNVYWAFANHLRVVGYLNYRLRQFGATSTSGRHHDLSRTAASAEPMATEHTAAFAEEHYDPRVKTYLRAEPSLLEDSILVQGSRQQDYAVFLDKLEQLLAYCRQEVCRTYIVVIPHVCQVEEAYLTYMHQLGARFTTPAAMRLAEYPFLEGLRDRFAARRHVHVVNPLPMLREERTKQAVYYPNDEHLTPSGQRALAAFLVEQLNLR